MIKLSQYDTNKPISKIKLLIQVGADLLSIKEMFQTGMLDLADTTELLVQLENRIREFSTTGDISDEDFKGDIENISIGSGLEDAELTDTGRLFRLISRQMNKVITEINLQSITDRQIIAHLDQLYTTYVASASTASGTDLGSLIAANHETISGNESEPVAVESNPVNPNLIKQINSRKDKRDSEESTLDAGGAQFYTAEPESIASYRQELSPEEQKKRWKLAARCLHSAWLTLHMLKEGRI